MMNATDIFPILYSYARQVVRDDIGRDKNARDCAAHAAMVLDESTFSELFAESSLEDELCRMFERGSVGPSEHRAWLIAEAARALREAGWTGALRGGTDDAAR